METRLQGVLYYSNFEMSNMKAFHSEGLLFIEERSNGHPDRDFSRLFLEILLKYQISNLKEFSTFFSILFSSFVVIFLYFPYYKTSAIEGM